MTDPIAGADARPATRLAPLLAGVVVFHPDVDHLCALVDTLRPQVAGVILFLNSPAPEELRRRFAAAPDVSFIEATANLGIGVGLNLLALAACLRGAAGLLFFDQDSTPSPTLVAHLADAWSHLEAAGMRPAVVSPLLVAKAGADSKAPTYRYLRAADGEATRQAAFVPTSGSLGSTDVLRRIGLFRADFFIDGIDIEWSFRARSQGYTCWVHTGCPMPHAVGSGVIGSRRLGWHMPRQRPFRMYCVIRNTLYGLRLRHIPFSWKLKQIAYLPLQASAFLLHHRLSWEVVKLLWFAAYDGLAGRLGPPRNPAR